MPIVDTCVWSLVFRRRVISEDAVTRELQRLISVREAYIIGAIRQEILSGISDPVLFQKVRRKLMAFADTVTGTQVHERAAEFSCICKRAGIASTSIDMLVCAVAEENELSILSTDRDFQHCARVLPIALHPTP